MIVVNLYLVYLVFYLVNQKNSTLTNLIKTSEQLKIPYGSVCGPNQYAKAKNLQHFPSIQINSQRMNDVDNTSNGLTQLLNELDREVFGVELRETVSDSLVAVGSDICLSQRNILCTDDNKSLVDHIVLDENLCETVNNNEM